MKHTPIFALLSLASRVVADSRCSCGFSVNKTDSAQFGIFKEYEETDFFHAVSAADSSRIGDTRWVAQVYNRSAEQVNRLIGFSKQLGNVITNPLPKGKWDCPPASIGDAGLQLWVRHQVEDDLVPVAGVDDSVNPTNASHMIYGSFRAAIKFSAMNGTRGVFSWQSASDERRQYIGMEFASRDTDAVQFTVYDKPAIKGKNTTEQDSGQYEDEKTQNDTTRYGASWTAVMNLPQEFHEYRFDWMPDRVDFYLDGHLMLTQSDCVPNVPGTLALRHFDDNDRVPPAQDAVMTVGYVKAYYNATMRDEPKPGCHSLEGTVCYVPVQDTPPNPDGGTHFYTDWMKEQAEDKKDDKTFAATGWDHHHDNGAATFGTGMLVTSFLFILACGLL